MPEQHQFGKKSDARDTVPASVAETSLHIKACHLLFGGAQGRRVDLKSSPPIILWALKNVFKGAYMAQQLLTLVGFVQFRSCNPWTIGGSIMAKATKNGSVFIARPEKSCEMQPQHAPEFL